MTVNLNYRSEHLLNDIVLTKDMRSDRVYYNCDAKGVSIFKTIYRKCEFSKYAFYYREYFEEKWKRFTCFDYYNSRYWKDMGTYNG